MKTQTKPKSDAKTELFRDQTEHFYHMSLDLLAIANFKGHFTNVNPAFAKALGYTIEELIATPFIEFVHPDDRAATLEAAAGLEDGKDAIEFENRYIAKDGKYHSLLWNATVNMKEEAIYAVARDITESKIIKNKLIESEENFRMMMMSAPSAMIVINEGGLIQLSNLHAQELFGYDASELVNKPVEILIPPEFLKNHKKLRAGYVQDPSPRAMGKGRELFALRKDGTQVPVEIGLTPYSSRNQNLFLAQILDITERVAAINALKNNEALLASKAELLQTSNSELEQFAYVASHDLQEPLRMISSYLQLLSRRYKGKLDSNAEEYINYAVDGATRMQNLINDLLSYSRIGSHRAEFKTVSIEDLVKQTLQNLKITIEERNAQITYQDLPMVKGDVIQLSQLFQNLINNAIKFCKDKQPVIQIKASVTKDAMWQFSIEDNGIGIEPQYFDRIFVIFQRLHNKENYSGTGIGLAICKKIVEQHGGEIWVESAPNHGTTFYFTLQYAASIN